MRKITFLLALLVIVGAMSPSSVLAQNSSAAPVAPPSVVPKTPTPTPTPVITPTPVAVVSPSPVAQPVSGVMDHTYLLLMAGLTLCGAGAYQVIVARKK